MIINHDEANARLNSPKNLLHKINRHISGPLPEEKLNTPQSIPDEVREESIKVDILPREANDIRIKVGKNRMMENMSPIERTIVGVLANNGSGLQKDIGKAFNISAGQVGAIGAGKTKSADNEAIGRAREGKFEAARDLAMEKLMGSLGLITEDKLANAKLTDLSRVATDMSRVIEKTSPRDTNSGQPVVNLTLYCPTVKSEKEYQVVEVRE